MKYNFLKEIAHRTHIWTDKQVWHKLGIFWRNNRSRKNKILGRVPWNVIKNLSLSRWWVALAWKSSLLKGWNAPLHYNALNFLNVVPSVRLFSDQLLQDILNVASQILYLSYYIKVSNGTEYLLGMYRRFLCRCRIGLI